MASYTKKRKDKAKFFAENFSKNSNPDDSDNSLPVFPSRTILKLHNISITPKMDKKVLMNLDLSKASGPYYVPVVVLKNWEPELPELFNKCLKESSRLLKGLIGSPYWETVYS